VLFNIVLDKVVREMNVSNEIALSYITIEFFACADNIAFLGDDKIFDKKNHICRSKNGINC